MRVGGARRPDVHHPFGHRRAEPIAALVTAIFIGILGFEVSKSGVLDLWAFLAGRPTSRAMGFMPIPALAVTIVLKSLMAVYYTRVGKQYNSPALRATAVDCRNDVLICLGSLSGVTLAERWVVLDSAAGTLVGLYIFYSAYRVGLENIHYLMGHAPPPELTARIAELARSVPYVRAVSDVRAHYVGHFVQVELSVHVDAELPTHQSHEIAEQVRQVIEGHELVDRAFVHVEPWRAD